MDRHSSSYMGRSPANRGSECNTNNQSQNRHHGCVRYTRFRDFGKEPFVADLRQVTKANNTFRTALWSGTHLQLTVMSIPACSDIGQEIHPDLDQLLYIEQGQGVVRMGARRDCLRFSRKVCEGYVIIVPACTWHNVINTGRCPLKLFSVYAPPEHPFGTVHDTKADAMAQEAAGMHEPY